MLVSVDVEDVARRARRVPVQGDADEMYRRAAAGEGVIVSENLASNQGVALGDRLVLATPSGPLTLPIVGVVVDWSDQLGTILIDRSVFVKAWQDDTVNVFRLYVTPGAEVDTVRRRIQAALADSHRAFVLTNADLRGYILGLTDQWLGLTYVQLAVAVLVAVLGIVNTLTVSIIDRRRELGVLRAVGALRQQIRRTVWIEAIAIAIVGVILGLLLGAVNLSYVLEVSHRDIGGMRLPYAFPWSIALMLVPIMIVSALLAALGPAEAAVRTVLVEALEYE
jgi:putative ABC transport system permease protein